MLPGFRFLFGAIVLSMSVLVFGFGAAALLRTAHEEFASAPAWRPAPETRFAQSQDNTQATQPVLALLRIDDAPKEAPKEAPHDTLRDADKDAAKVEPQALDDVPMKAAAEPATAPSPQPDLDKTAALQPMDAPPSAAATPETAPPQAEATASPAAPDQAKLATAVQPPAHAPAPTTTATATAPASEAAPLPAAEAAPVAPEQTSAPAAASFSTKIATLGGPPVTIVSPKPASPKPDREDRDAVRKRQAHRAAQRRRLAALRLQRQAAQQALTPFGQTPVNPNPAH
jgi:hypothetical protein